jgi:hypothetical protein
MRKVVLCMILVWLAECVIVVELRCSAGKLHLRRGKISVYVYYLK